MKKTIITALFAAICVAPAFAAGQSISAKSAGIGYEYTSLNTDGADWTMNSAVIRGNYDFYKFNNGVTVTLTGAAYYGVGSIEFDTDKWRDVDATRYGAKVGLMFNYHATEKLSIYAGPTIGYNVFSYEGKGANKDADIKDDTGMTYGVTVGARYMLPNQKTAIDLGLSLDNYALPESGGDNGVWDDDRVGSTSFFVGISQSF